jgi:cysteinyl-tRNA synthetase
MTLRVYNSLTREMDVFAPLNPPFVGIYVCGPTVYGDAHIGHAKSYIAFDLVVRYLRFLDYKVRYVQNITDVGHLTDDADQGEDKIEKRATLEQVHPMQLAETYTQRYFADMDALGVLRPDISPRATGHIPEQIALTRQLLDRGHAYEVAGNVYFDVASWDDYGKLSRRRLDDAESGTRVEARSDKRHPADFALWKRAEPDHVLQWDSPWGRGYPGWHIECSVMSQKYLGESFDIHGGGLENMFPHHEDEIAQSEAACGKPFAKYWLHNNMVTVGGQKMGKSLGNFVTLRDAFETFDPLVVRFVILQGHYRSPFDYSEESLEAGRKGYERLVGAVKAVRQAMGHAAEGDASDDVATLVAGIETRFRAAMDDDFNSAGALATLFELANAANTASRDTATTRGSLELMDDAFRRLGGDVLGLVRDTYDEDTSGVMAVVDKLVGSMIAMRKRARDAKDFAAADGVRDDLAAMGIKLEDGPSGTTWQLD